MTTNAQNQAKAVALISGGLDSMLAARVVKDQGVHVEGLNFFTGFCVEGHTHAIRNHDRNRPKQIPSTAPNSRFPWPTRST